MNRRSKRKKRVRAARQDYVALSARSPAEITTLPSSTVDQMPIYTHPSLSTPTETPTSVQGSLHPASSSGSDVTHLSPSVAPIISSLTPLPVMVSGQNTQSFSSRLTSQVGTGQKNDHQQETWLMVNASDGDKHGHPADKNAVVADESTGARSEDVTNMSESMFDDLLKELQLQAYYPQKLTLMEVIRIRDVKHHDRLNGLPWVFLRNIMMNNYKCRDVFIEQHLEKFAKSDKCKSDDWNVDVNVDLCEDESDRLNINPLDLVLILFECCSHELKQVLAKKMFLCRHAIPFVPPPKPSNLPVVGVWPILPIMIEHGSQQISALKCPCHVISFVRLGKLVTSISKSKIINHLLADQYHDTFFNRDCPLGTNMRLVSEGMVEAAWQLSSKISEIPMLYLNLRGDGLSWNQQLSFLSQISSVLVVMLDIKHIDNETTIVLRGLYEGHSRIVLCIDAFDHKQEQTVKSLCQRYLKDIATYKNKPLICKLAVNGRLESFSDLKKNLVRRLTEILTQCKVHSFKERIQNLHNKCFTTDQELQLLKTAEQKATYLIGTIPHGCDKQHVVPLQGKLWQKFSEQLKESQQTTRAQTISKQEERKAKMNGYRQEQVKAIRRQHRMMKIFIQNLVDKTQSDEEHILFITYLKLYLDERSRKVLPQFLSKYQKAWQEWKAAKDKGQTNIQSLQANLQTAELKLADASFGLEHLLRECGQIYEAIMHCTEMTSDAEKSMAMSLSKACAKLILLGQPFEVMDGDASNVPQKWVKAVLQELKLLVGDKRLLSLSVLGIQSSGKSTLLNTVFGLQFAVSAGRCTRGVFIQLLPVNKKRMKFDYILVIDTEGLRASELALEKCDHDNKLATFVIGLGDITIINVKGENTAEMEDILQIAVHAFLRLKLANATIKLKQSCVFVHQNVSASDASEKMMHARQKLVEKLDEMTKEAAQQEMITNIQSFNQVIGFNIETDVLYFPDLWIGNPPMAPTNPEYSTKADEINNAVISKLTHSRDTFFTITDTVSRIEDLWNGIITDDFVFAFRNSLEVKAYSSMEKQFQETRFAVSNFFSQFILKTAKVQIENCSNGNQLEKKNQEVLLTLRKQAATILDTFKNQLEKFVDDNELKDVMVQWIDTKKIQLRNWKDSLLASTERHISKLRDEKRLQLLQADAKVRHETKINERARDLANRLKGKEADMNQMNQMFEAMWEDLLQELSSTTENNNDGNSIRVQIETYVWEQFQEIGKYLTTQKTTKQYKSKIKGSLSGDDFNEDEHFQIHKNFLKKAGEYTRILKKEKNKKYNDQVAQNANIIFARIDTKLEEITKQDIPFNISFVNDVLGIIVSAWNDHNNHDAKTLHFNLLPPYKAFLVVHVLPHMTAVFISHNEEYNKRQSLEAQIHKYKATAWELFRNLVSHATEEIIAASFFINAMQDKITKHVSEMIPPDVQSILRSNISVSKYGIMKCIMKYLAENGDFGECMDYILDPSNFAEGWLTSQMDEMIFSKSESRTSQYAQIANIHITKIFIEIEKSIRIATQKCSAEGRVSPESWSTVFTSTLVESAALPISTDTFVHVMKRQINDIQNFETLLLDQLKETQKKVFQGFCTENSTNIKWKEHPIQKMMDDLWGCKEECPFCSEPCKHTEKDHLDTGIKHECIQHRIEGINGTRLHKTRIFALTFCNINMTSRISFVQTSSKGEIHTKYRDYQKRYPDWYIQPNSDQSKYWMWFLCHHKEKLAEFFDLEFEAIPDSWSKISKEDAIHSVQ